MRDEELEEKWCLNRVKGVEDDQDIHEVDEIMDFKIVDFDEEKAIRNVCSTILKSLE